MPLRLSSLHEIAAQRSHRGDTWPRSTGDLRAYRSNGYSSARWCARLLRHACPDAGVIVAAFLLTGAAHGATDTDKIKALGGGRYLISIVQSVPASGLSSLHLSGPSNLGGHIIVSVGPPDSVRIEINKLLRVDSQNLATKLFQEINVTPHPVGSALNLDVVTPTGAMWEGTDWGITLDLTVAVPPQWDIDIDAQYFEYDLNGPFRDVSVTTKYGRVKLQGVDRRTDIRGEYTGMEVSDVKGVIDVTTSYADLRLRRAVSDPERPARLENTYGPITVSDLVGAVNTQTGSAPIRLDRISLVGSTSRVQGENVTVDADIIEFGSARLEIQTSHAPVRVNVPGRLSARLNLSVGPGGVIRTRGLLIQTHENLLGSDRLEGICGSGNGQIDIDLSGPGVIELRGK